MGEKGLTPSWQTLPQVGLNENVPQYEAGRMTDPGKELGVSNVASSLAQYPTSGLCTNRNLNLAVRDGSC